MFSSFIWIQFPYDVHLRPKNLSSETFGEISNQMAKSIPHGLRDLAKILVYVGQTSLENY